MISGWVLPFFYQHYTDYESGQASLQNDHEISPWMWSVFFVLECVHGEIATTMTNLPNEDRYAALKTKSWQTTDHGKTFIFYRWWPDEPFHIFERKKSHFPQVEVDRKRHYGGEDEKDFRSEGKEYLDLTIIRLDCICEQIRRSAVQYEAGCASVSARFTMTRCDGGFRWGVGNHTGFVIIKSRVSVAFFSVIFGNG